MILLDVSIYTVIVECSNCPWFRDLASSREEARAMGARHEQREHPDQKQARAAQRMATRRIDR